MAKFRLDRVIEVKNRVIDDKKKELELTLLTLRNTDDAVADLDAAMKEGYETMGASPMVGSDFTVLRDFLFSLDARKAALLAERARISAELDALRAQLFELAKEMRMLEKLKSKALEREKKELNRREQKIMDDMALRAEERKP